MNTIVYFCRVYL